MLLPTVRKKIAHYLWPNDFGVVRRDGAAFLLDISHWYDQQMFQRGCVEPLQRDFLLKKLRQTPFDIFLDIGSNIGTYALAVALHTHIPAIIAFEPDQRNYDRLRTNLILNRLTDKIETRMAAISDRTGMISFNFGPDGDASSSKIDDTAAGKVPCFKLDDAIKVKEKKIALKIDIEGHQLTALLGMQELLTNNDCFLQVECWPIGSHTAFAEKIGEMGYKEIHHIDYDYYFSR